MRAKTENCSLGVENSKGGTVRIVSSGARTSLGTATKGVHNSATGNCSSRILGSERMRDRRTDRSMAVRRTAVAGSMRCNRALETGRNWAGWRRNSAAWKSRNRVAMLVAVRKRTDSVGCRRVA